MIQRSVAQQPGMAEFLLGLNAGEFHSGGFIQAADIIKVAAALATGILKARDLCRIGLSRRT
jgi:hypothetical protein